MGDSHSVCIVSVVNSNSFQDDSEDSSVCSLSCANEILEFCPCLSIVNSSISFGKSEDNSTSNLAFLVRLSKSVRVLSMASDSELSEDVEREA
jgi:hypothetical protein